MSRVTGRFVADRDGLAAVFVYGGVAWLEMTRFLNRVKSRAKLYAPVDTGRLRQSISLSVDTSDRQVVRGTVYTNVEYALWVHDGTRPHVIRARPGGMLAFSVGGRKVYARQVQHPGTRPRPFLLRALQEEAGSLT